MYRDADFFSCFYAVIAKLNSACWPVAARYKSLFSKIVIAMTSQQTSSPLLRLSSLTFLTPLVLCLACAAAAAQTEPSAQPAGAVADPVPAHSVTGNLALVSDYRFRGISQSWRQPAVQGGLDYVHASGFYLGNWNSSVSSNSYNNGGSVEVDLYGGYRFEPVKDLMMDVGVLTYIYPGARLNTAPASPSDKKYDNTEIYAGLTHGAFNAKLSYAVTDYFGLNGDTAGYAYFSALPNRGSSSGTTYIDLNYNLDLGSQVTLGLHAGHTTVRRYSELSYTDYKVSLNKELSGFNLGVAVVGTDAEPRFYQVGDSSGGNGKVVGKTAVVLSVAKAF